jgi:hypothetical protein
LLLGISFFSFGEAAKKMGKKSPWLYGCDDDDEYCVSQFLVEF